MLNASNEIQALQAIIKLQRQSRHRQWSQTCQCLTPRMPLSASSRLREQKSGECVLSCLPEEETLRDIGGRWWRGSRQGLTDGGTPEGDTQCGLLLPPHCWKKKVGLNMTSGSRTQHTIRKHSFSPSAEHLSARLLTSRPFRVTGAFLSQTHTKTLPINACRIFITDTDAVHCANPAFTGKHPQPKSARLQISCPF